MQVLDLVQKSTIGIRAPAQRLGFQMLQRDLGTLSFSQAVWRVKVVLFQYQYNPNITPMGLYSSVKGVLGSLATLVQQSLRSWVLFDSFLHAQATGALTCCFAGHSAQVLQAFAVSFWWFNLGCSPHSLKGAI